MPQSSSYSVQPCGEKEGCGRLIGQTKGGINTKRHAICDSQGRPLNLSVTVGQVSDYIGAVALGGSLPKIKWLLGDRGYDADWFREALEDKGIGACIPGRKQRKKTVTYDKRRYKRRNRIEIMFGRLKDWRRVATRYDRCPKVFLSAIALAALVVYWRYVLNLKKIRLAPAFHRPDQLSFNLGDTPNRQGHKLLQMIVQFARQIHWSVFATCKHLHAHSHRIAKLNCRARCQLDTVWAFGNLRTIAQVGSRAVPWFDAQEGRSFGSPKRQIWEIVKLKIKARPV